MATMAQVTNRHASLKIEKAQALVAAYQSEGLTSSEDGEEKIARAEFAERVLDVMVAKAIVQKKSELQTNAIVLEDLAVLVFPSTTNPASPDWPVDDDESDEAEITRHVWGRVKTEVSKAVQTGRKGSVQLLLAGNPDPDMSQLIVCQTKVGTKPTKAVYLSDDKDMIVLGLAMPRTTKLSTLSENIADDFSFAMEHNSGVQKALKDKMETGLKAARDTARAKLALTSGDEPDDV